MWGHPDQDGGPARLRREAGRRVDGVTSARRPALRRRRRRRRAPAARRRARTTARRGAGAGRPRSPTRLADAGVERRRAGRRDAARTPTSSPRCSACGGPAACTCRSTRASARRPRPRPRGGRARRRSSPPPSTSTASATGRWSSSATRVDAPARARRAPTRSTPTSPWSSSPRARPAAQAGAPRRTPACSPLLDGVLATLRRRAGRSGQAADAEPHPGVAVAVGRHLQGAVRPRVGAPVVVMDGFDTAGVRRGSSTGSRSARPCCRPRRWRCSPTTSRSRPRPAAVRAQHHRAAVAAAGPPVPRPVRHRRPQRLRPDRDRRRDHRLERAPTPRSTATTSSAPSAGPTPASRCATDDGDRRAAGAHPGAVGGLRRRRATSADRLTDDGWFRTGDIGRVDDDGFVWIEGRVSDMINRGGLKVFPGEVEEVLRLSPEVADVAVVGVARRPPRRGAVGVRRRRRRRAADADAPRRRCAASTWRPTRCRSGFEVRRRAAPQRGRQGAHARARRGR